MNALNGIAIDLVDLAIYANNTLIFSDFHIGYEEALNKQGLMVPRFQFQEIMARLNLIFDRLKHKKIETVVINGDLKHEFGDISEQEWRHTLRLLDYFGWYCKEVILIKGNHDAVLGPIARKRNVKVLDYYILGSDTTGKNTITGKTIKNRLINNKNTIIKAQKIIADKIKSNNKKNKILVMHGDKIPNKELLKDVSAIIIGHEHPAVSIGEGPRTELFKAYLIGKWKGKNLIAQPSFNLVTEGTDVLKENLLSPFLKQNLGNFDAVVVADNLYRFGKIKDLS